MAVVAYSVETLKTHKEKTLLYTWVLENGDTGVPVEMPGFADRSVQVEGTFGSGGNLRIQGSNNGTKYLPLTDPQGNDLNITTAKIEQVTEVVRWIRPNVTAGDGTTSLTVILLVRRN
jgi:hypothetical protein